MFIDIAERLAVAPFVIIWRCPAALLTKSLATVVAMLFFTMILMSLGHTAAKGYANFTFSPCLDMLGKTLSDEKVDPAVSAVIRKWQSSGESYHALRNALQDIQPPEPTEQPAEPQPAATEPQPEASEPPPEPPPAEK